MAHHPEFISGSHLLGYYIANGVLKQVQHDAGIKSDLQISNPAPHAFNIVTDIQHNTGEEVKYKREAYRQERRVDEE